MFSCKHTPPLDGMAAKAAPVILKKSRVKPDAMFSTCLKRVNPCFQSCRKTGFSTFQDLAGTQNAFKPLLSLRELMVR